MPPSSAATPSSSNTPLKYHAAENRSLGVLVILPARKNTSAASSKSVIEVMVWAVIGLQCDGTSNETPRSRTRPNCSIPRASIWIDSEHAIACSADAPAAEGRIIIVPRGPAPRVRAAGGGAAGRWALVSEVRGRLRTGMMPDGGFSIGFLDGLTATVPVPLA